MLANYYFVTSLFFAFAVAQGGERLPPQPLLLEAVAKAGAIVWATVDSAEIPRGGFAATTVSIKKVYRGPLKPGASLTYFSMRETAAYSGHARKAGLIVFLVERQSGGAQDWGAASDLFEFEYSAELERRLNALLRKKKT